jgi:hypothetical protein
MITRASGLYKEALFIVVAALGLFQLQARQPDWVTGLGKSVQYPESRYFTGFGISFSNDKTPFGEKIEQAKNSAKSSLVESMQVRVQVSRSDGTTLHSTHGGKQELQTDYQSHVSSSSDMDIEGIDYEVYGSKANEQIFALAYLDKQKALEKYGRRLQSRLALLREMQDNMEEFITQGDIIAAQDLDNECKNILDNIDSLKSIMEILGEPGVSEALAAIKQRASQLHRLVGEHLTGASITGDSLRVMLWTSEGRDNIRLHFGQLLTVFIRVNKPCYLHLLCRLSNNFWVIPDYRYWNFYFDQKNANKDYALPDKFIATYPLGTDTLWPIVSEKQLPICECQPRVIEGESYLVLPKSCIPENSNGTDRFSKASATGKVSIAIYK